MLVLPDTVRGMYDASLGRWGCAWMTRTTRSSALKNEYPRCAPPCATFDDEVLVDATDPRDSDSDDSRASPPPTPRCSCVDVNAFAAHRAPFADARARQHAANAAMMIRRTYNIANSDAVFPFIDLDLGKCTRPTRRCEDPMHVVSGACALFRAIVDEAELSRRGLDQSIRKLLAVCLLTVYKVRSEGSFYVHNTMMTVATGFLYEQECPDSQDRCNALQCELTALEFDVIANSAFFSIVENGIAAAIDIELYARCADWKLTSNDIANAIALANFHHFAAMSLGNTDPIEALVAKGMSVAELGRVFVLLARGSILMLTDDAGALGLYSYSRAVGRAAAVIARHTLLAAGTVSGLRIGSFLDTQTVVGACVTLDALHSLVKLFV